MSDMAERYEAEAEAFYKATGVMAPGKDSPAEMGGYDADELRHKLWRMWARAVYAERERDEARRERDALKEELSAEKERREKWRRQASTWQGACMMAADTLGGEVEGKPTHEGNFLQRLRQAVANEEVYFGMLERTNAEVSELKNTVEALRHRAERAERQLATMKAAGMMEMRERAERAERVVGAVRAFVHCDRTDNVAQLLGAMGDALRALDAHHASEGEG